MQLAIPAFNFSHQAFLELFCIIVRHNIVLETSPVLDSTAASPLKSSISRNHACAKIASPFDNLHEIAEFHKLDEIVELLFGNSLLVGSSR